MKFTKWLQLKEIRRSGGYANSIGSGQVFTHQMNNVASDDGFKKLRSKYMAGSEKDHSKYNVDSLFKKKKKTINKDMRNFKEFCESKNDQEESKSLDIIRIGNNVLKKDCGIFWDIFFNLCANTEAMAELLDVPKDKVSSWAGRINKFRSELNSDNESSKTKNRIIRTDK